MHTSNFIRRAAFAIGAFITGVLASAPARAQINLPHAEPIPGKIFGVSLEACNPQSPELCICDLRRLRPLQGAVGLGEVAKKTKDLEDPEKLENEKKDLQHDPIKVVQGPDGDLFVTDHHHGARAWIEAGYTAGICMKRSGPDAALGTFYQQLESMKLVRLKDEKGELITPDDLRTKLPGLTDLPDDPYRTLAWMVRKEDGYCRALMTQPPPEFAEFSWADAMRRRADLPQEKVKLATAPGLWKSAPGETDKQLKARRKAAQSDILKAALAFATSSEAAGLPGYRGTGGLAGTCNPKDD